MRKAFAALITSGVLPGPGVSARAVEVNARHLRHYVRPSLPEIAKKMGLKGAVRLEMQIVRDGKVTNIRALGGHPLLVEAASEAVHTWQFEAGKEETKGEVSLLFQ